MVEMVEGKWTADSLERGHDAYCIVSLTTLAREAVIAHVVGRHRQGNSWDWTGLGERLLHGNI